MTNPTPREIQKRLLVRTTEPGPGWEAPWRPENIQLLELSRRRDWASLIVGLLPPPLPWLFTGRLKGWKSAFMTVELHLVPPNICLRF